MSPRAVIVVLLLALIACQADQTLKPLDPPPPPSDENHPPRAQLSVAAEALEGAPLIFNNKGSDDDDGDRLVFNLTFGDGDSALTAETAVSHTYRNDGSYTATLIVYDLRGAADTAVATIHVVNVAPQITLVRIPEHSIGGGIPTEIDIQYSDPGLDDTLSAFVEFILAGSVARTAVLRGPGIMTTTLLDPGPYQLRVTVRDGDGGVAEQKAERTLDIVGRYEVVDLGTLGGQTAMPLALNDNAQVVGYSTTSDGTEKAFLWDGAMRDLDISPYSRAYAITNSGIIAGAADGGVFRWINGVTTILGAADDPAIPGITLDKVLVSTYDTEHAPRSALWVAGEWRAVSGFGYGGFAVAKAMNSSGQVVGAAPIYEVAGEKVFHAFVWQSGVMRDLGFLGGLPCGNNPSLNCGESWAWDINSNGDIAGYSSTESDGAHAVVWTREGEMVDLGLGQALAINELGDVAGSRYQFPIEAAFIWRHGNRIELPTLGGQRTTVVDLNDRSMALGTGMTGEGKSHVFVWSPDRGTVDLGAGPRGEDATAVAINARGDVIGFTFSSQAPWPGEPPRAVLWRKKG